MPSAPVGVTPAIPFERRSGVPYYKQIYDGYRAAILAGRLRPGARLPSSRGLAEELGISRLPVVNAFEQLLHEGYIQGRVGSGTYVRQSIPEHLMIAGPPQPARPPARTAHRSASPWPSPLRISLPALDRFPRGVWARLVRRHADVAPLELMAYGDPAGHLPLREAIADHVRAARAVDCEADQVVIVSGSQLALHICAMALLRPGDAVSMEEPGYPGARDAMAISGATVIPVPLDDEGVDVAAMERLRRPPRLAYVTPSHQYPLGITMSASRRLELLAWAHRHDAFVLEDDYDSEYRYASRPLGALQGMDSRGRVIYIGTFSKVLFPSLRIGYLVVPRALVGRILMVREALDIFPPALNQLVLTDFIREGHLARHVRRMRTLYQGRRDALIGAVHRRLGHRLLIRNADAGLHVAAFLTGHIDDRTVERRAIERGIGPTALSTCYGGARPRSGLILGFGGTDASQMEGAVDVLGSVIDEVAEGR